MKILHLNTYETSGGAARAAGRLHRALCQSDVDSRMLVQFRGSDDPTVLAPSGRLARSMARLRPYLDTLPVKCYRHRQTNTFAPAVVPDGIATQVGRFDPEIVHLHWVASGFLRPESLGRIQRPIVWTLHDSWPFTGGCHLPGNCTRYCQSCGCCPRLGSKREIDLSRKVWQRKRETFQGLDLTLVAPSHWMATCARNSSLFKNLRVEMIPHGLDVGHFKPGDKAFARQVLGLPAKKKLVLFCAMGAMTDHNKGFHLLPDVFGRFLRDSPGLSVSLVVAGSSRPDEFGGFPVDVHFLGKLSDDTRLQLAYSAADVLVVPSLSESFGNVIMESMACGTPCVAFDTGGIPDLVEHMKNGYLAQAFDPCGIAEGLRWVLEEPERYQRLSFEGREKALAEYDSNRMASHYLDLYREIAN